MKKVLFLMVLLFLIVLGTVSLSAQVRIGGNGVPNAAAVLDLNADDTNAGAKGLALPRVSLTNVSTPLTGTPTVNGMLVYNTGGALTAGIYFWSGSIWNRVDDAIGNELTDTIAGGGLTKSGAGTAASPWKVGIKAGGVITGMIADRAVTLTKIGTSPVDSGRFLMSNGTTVVTYSGALQNDTITRDLRINRSQAVSWTLILDTTININLRLGYYKDVPTLGLLFTDACRASSTGGGLTLTSTANYIRFWTAERIAFSWNNLRVMCYRPG